MAKKSFPMECASCMNSCVIAGQNADMAAYCPFCGEGVIMSYDDTDHDETFGTEYDLDDDDDV
jgi:predicted RNA-binding Zn-ribbon protein involved in translation (DUF1610 family)